MCVVSWYRRCRSIEDVDVGVEVDVEVDADVGADVDVEVDTDVGADVDVEVDTDVGEGVGTEVLSGYSPDTKW